MIKWFPLAVFDKTGPVNCARHHIYIKWLGMLRRCYDKKHQRKDYVGMSVDPKFYKFSDFATWALSQVGGHVPEFELDKDILGDGSRIYSPDTCSFVPTELNRAISGCVNPKKKPNGLPLGVVKRKAARPYSADISINGKKTYIGSFHTEEEAFSAYEKEKEKYLMSLAEKYKDVIDIRVYEALCNFTVGADYRALNKTEGA